jgi:pimeloyl-ACP methyl ester carboxylesterase
MHEVELSAGTIRYRDSGTGPPIVFVHGFLVSGTLWRKVVPRLEDRYRCIVPDWPLGAHTKPMRDGADLSPPGIARLIAEFLERLDLRDVTLVGNDSGGAISQMLVAEQPERVGRLVLTSCDAFDNFPPKLFRPLLAAARVPPLVSASIQTLRLHPLRRLPFAFGFVTKRPIPRQTTDEWLRPYFTDKAVRRDVITLARGWKRRDLVETTKKLPAFGKPVLLVWAVEDRIFPFEHARRLAEVFPDARVEEVHDSYAFVSEDQPERVAQLIGEFAAAAAEPAADPERAGTQVSPS